MFAVSKKLGNEHFAADSLFLTWPLCRAAWLYNRCVVRGDANLTPCENARMLRYQMPIVSVGEAVICKRPGAQVNMLELSWPDGIWLGRYARAYEHVIGAPTGVTRDRVIRRNMESMR